MIIFNYIEAIEQFSQVEIRKQRLETISNISEGATSTQASMVNSQ